MIDRGALVLGAAEGSTYGGLRRTPLDGLAFTGRKGKDLARRYADALVDGDGVLEDLDDAIAMRDAARQMGFAVDAVVFAVPQTAWEPRGLPVVEAPPADDLEFLGWDVIEPLEPWDSAIARTTPPGVNEHGLLRDRAEAEALAAQRNANTEEPGDEPYVAARIWRVKG